MERRDFLKGAALLPLLAQLGFARRRPAVQGPRIVKPRRLAPGDQVAIIAPSSGIEPEGFEGAVQSLRELGLAPQIGRHARAQNGFLAGTDRERLADMHEAFADRRVKAVWCVRGGYGASRILPALNFELIRKNPKILIGYSDITALLTAISQRTGLVTFHGPAAASSFTDYTKSHVTSVLMNPAANYKIEVAPENAANESNLFKTTTIRSGKCRGRLIGGNLSLLAALAGTPYGLRNLRGKILFIEDVNEKPYRIDRMLTQLKESAELQNLAGIALGIFKGCNSDEVEGTQSVLDVLTERLGSLKIPVVYGLSFGHIRDQCTLPVGIRAELDAEKATLTFLEKAVI